MAVNIDWFDENHVIFMQFQEFIAIDDLVEASYNGHAMSMLGDPPVHILVDGRKAKTFPMNAKQMSERLPEHPAPERVGWVLVVTPDNVLMRIITALFTHFEIMRGKFRLFTDMPSALEFLREQDSRLNQPPIP